MSGCSVDIAGVRYTSAVGKFSGTKHTCSSQILRAMEEAQLRESHNAAMAWFSQFQLECVIRNGIIPEWFHGIISRKCAEEMLLPRPVGYFLIRVSESRIGYTLSYRAEDRCRHFMIDVLKNGQYNVVGENTNHRSLQDLVSFHRRVPILPFNELLTVACGQVSKDKADYAELLFSQRKPLTPTPPALAVQGPSMTNRVVPVPLPRKKFASVNTAVRRPQPPELPSRNSLPTRREQTNSGPHQLSPPNLNCVAPAPNEQANPGMKSAVVSLMALKRKSQEKGGDGEEHVYTELSEANDTADSCNDQLSLPALEGRAGKKVDCENVYQEMPVEKPIVEPNTSRAHTVDSPEEYSNPPPFAPGYWAH
ncbi:hypothetical protein AAFF_G00256940 [Aldrovandia affinis]|uniref:SH2 domain-containing protein n=1 Tax=Aldrovandia affinis TaxID=143900 RepID=A0AAD7STF1_9TELE|nr:hypothetical protein AAFF_G00256940 [Aldrovandia affinis]